MKKVKLGPKLMALFILLGITPLLFISGMSFWKSNDALLQSNFEKLSALSNLKLDQLKNYVHELKMQLELMDQSNEVHKLYA